MTDRELLEFAAKAAGLRINFHPTASYQWNPLERDDDALRLSVKLKIGVIQWSDSVSATHAITNREYSELYGSDPYAATRRAIVRAAVAIGEEMP